jgi:hypothetical protein
MKKELDAFLYKDGTEYKVMSFSDGAEFCSKLVENECSEAFKLCYIRPREFTDKDLNYMFFAGKKCGSLGLKNTSSYYINRLRNYVPVKVVVNELEEVISIRCDI